MEQKREEFEAYVFVTSKLVETDSYEFTPLNLHWIKL